VVPGYGAPMSNAREPNLEVQLGFAGTAAASLTALAWFAMDSARVEGTADGALYSLMVVACGVAMALAFDLVLFLALRTMWMAWAMAQQEDFAQVDDMDLTHWYRRGSGWFADALGRFVGWAWMGVLLVVLELSARLHSLFALGVLIAASVGVGFAVFGPGGARLAALHGPWRWWVWDAWSVPGAPTGWRRVVNVVWSIATVGVFSLVAITYTMVPSLTVDPMMVAANEPSWARLELAALRGEQTQVLGTLDQDIDLMFERVGDTYFAELPMADLTPGIHTVIVSVKATFDDGGEYQFTAGTDAQFWVRAE
jgi:hypothetical protein